MKLSLEWLSTYFSEHAPDWVHLLQRLTMAGIEAEDTSVVVAAGDGTARQQVIDFKITPNRGDCLSVLGILRELAVLLPPQLMPNAIAAISPAIDNSNVILQLDVKVHDDAACPHYAALVVSGIDNNASLPEFMLQRLLSSGVRSISPVVDITNYVMLELGQPLHAFDYSTLNQGLAVRFALAGETLQLLHGEVVNLSDDTLLICDGSDTPIALAGIMGGLHTAITSNTRDIVLESAYFAPQVIAQRAKRYKLSSNAAYRFERGVDPMLQIQAIEYAASLIVQYCGGNAKALISSKNNGFYQTWLSRHVIVSYGDICQLIGMEIDAAVIDDILLRLGFITSVINSSGVKDNDNIRRVMIPSHRFDITIWQGIAQEVARIYGYEQIPKQMPVMSYFIPDVADNHEWRMKSCLATLGYHEIISYAFLEDKIEQLLGNVDVRAIGLNNSIAGLEVLRTSLLADLVMALDYNLKRGCDRVQVFELARVFYSVEQDQNNVQAQPLKLAALAYGAYSVSDWHEQKRHFDFYDIKAHLEVLLSGLSLQFKPSCRGYMSHVMHGGIRAGIYASDTNGVLYDIGVVGQLHPRYSSIFSWEALPYVFELDVATIIAVTNNTTHKSRAVSKFQKVRRDLSWLVADASVLIGDIIDCVYAASIPYLRHVALFDIYRGNLGQSGALYSIALSFLFQADDKTLSDTEINHSILKIRHVLEDGDRFKLRLRAYNE